MRLIRRPWAQRAEDPDEAIFGPADCPLGDANARENARSRHAVLLTRGDQELRLFPYPKTGLSNADVKVAGLPARPKIGFEPRTEEEEKAVAASGSDSAALRANVGLTETSQSEFSSPAEMGSTLGGKKQW